MHHPTSWVRVRLPLAAAAAAAVHAVVVVAPLLPSIWLPLVSVPPFPPLSLNPFLCQTAAMLGCSDYIFFLLRADFEM
jgi:hypothetical protein